MSNKNGIERWREDAWRLHPDQQKADHPAPAEELRLERRLTAALNRLPQAPVSSNFTARVLQAVAKEQAPARKSHRPEWLSHWLPRLAFGCLMLGAGVIAWDRIEDAREARIAESVVTISASVPSPEILKDFEAIRALSSTPPADEQLLAILE